MSSARTLLCFVTIHSLIEHFSRNRYLTNSLSLVFGSFRNLLPVNLNFVAVHYAKLRDTFNFLSSMAYVIPNLGSLAATRAYYQVLTLTLDTFSDFDDNSQIADISVSMLVRD